jgi:hypothetical protein
MPGRDGQWRRERKGGCGIPQTVAEQSGDEAECSQQSKDKRHSPHTSVIPAKAGTHRPLALSRLVLGPR